MYRYCIGNIIVVYSEIIELVMIVIWKKKKFCVCFSFSGHRFVTVAPPITNTYYTYTTIFIYAILSYRKKKNNKIMIIKITTLSHRGIVIPLPSKLVARNCLSGRAEGTCIYFTG